MVLEHFDYFNYLTISFNFLIDKYNSMIQRTQNSVVNPPGIST